MSFTFDVDAVRLQNGSYPGLRLTKTSVDKICGKYEEETNAAYLVEVVTSHAGEQVVFNLHVQPSVHPLGQFVVRYVERRP